MSPNEDRKIREHFTPKTWNEIKTNDSWAIFKIMSEFVDGYERLSKIGPCVSIFGSARTKPGEENYILVGPGRWGSSDPWLGISVNWSQISAARLIVESGLEDYRIDPSQGTHFFQNLTSFRIGYFTVNPFINDGIYDIDFLDKQPAVFENEFVRHVKFDKSLKIIIDGKKNLGMVLKP